MLTKKIGGLFVALSLAFGFAEAADFPEFIEDTPGNRAAYERAMNHLEENASAYNELVGCSNYGGRSGDSKNLITHLVGLEFYSVEGLARYYDYCRRSEYYQDWWINKHGIIVRVKNHEDGYTDYTISVLRKTPLKWGAVSGSIMGCDYALLFDTKKDNQLAKLVVESRSIFPVPPFHRNREGRFHYDSYDEANKVLKRAHYVLNGRVSRMDESLVTYQAEDRRGGA